MSPYSNYFNRINSVSGSRTNHSKSGSYTADWIRILIAVRGGSDFKTGFLSISDRIRIRNRLLSSLAPTPFEKTNWKCETDLNSDPCNCVKSTFAPDPLISDRIPLNNQAGNVKLILIRILITTSELDPVSEPDPYHYTNRNRIRTELYQTWYRIPLKN